MRCATKLKAKLDSDSRDGHPDSLVRDALKQISTYCEKLPQDSATALDCWDAYYYFANEAMSAEIACDIESPEGSLSGQACNNFLQWESFVRQVESSGSVKQMVNTILALMRAKKGDASKSKPTKKSSIVPVSNILDDANTRQLCEKLFNLKDKNQDGRINVEEFRSLMQQLGDEVHGDTISIMFEALDIRGSLTFDDFYTILEAESIRSHSAGFLRSAQKHGHYGDVPKWLDNRCPDIVRWQHHMQHELQNPNHVAPGWNSADEFSGNLLTNHKGLCPIRGITDPAVTSITHHLPAPCADVYSLTPEAGFEFGRLLEGQKVNHFPRHVELTRKDLLAKNLKRAKRQLDKEGCGAELDFFPKTYVLPQEYGLFSDAFRKTGGVWIMKPCGRAQGRGIFLLDKLSQVIKWRKEMEEKERLETYKDVYVVSKYIERPYLIDERKFDIRLYVLVLSFTPLRAYVYRGGFCRFSTESYSHSKECLGDVSMHLTNVAVQKKGGGYDGGRLKWRLHGLRQYLMAHVERSRAEAIFAEIQSVIIRSLLSVQHVVTQDKHCFEIYGYDILLDSDLKPWLIEVNASPSLQTDSPEDFQLKFNLFNDALTLLDFENRFEGRLPMTCGGFDVIYDQGNIVQVHPHVKSMMGCYIPGQEWSVHSPRKDGIAAESGT